jgi:NTP pyrophosphatase (non-canonical NTP hydrolase)
MKEDLEHIIQYYGIRNQLKKFNEETYELIEAINDYEWIIDERGRCDKNKILEEFADCMVMLEQFKAYYNLDNDKIIDMMKFKINRQLERINNENK